LPSRGRSLKPDLYPSFTMLWQAIASVRVCFEALMLCPCDIFVDTMGVGYAYPFVKLFFNPKIYSYTHYPLVQYDMMRDVIQGVSQFNNREDIAKSLYKRQLKKIYYIGLTYVYSFCGRFFVDQIATNSSWTNNHILQLWNRPKQTKIVYPPVDTTDLINMTSDMSATHRRNLMVSFAQFRPEKDQALQLRVWKRVLP
jgi:alpha-1,2-mannosyltransferase